ncbi:MAG: O-antigen ligase family protein, partial [Candidatus Eremiobacteraeota bacterium]|nr:O-antigen ligase family protein [Candidatus Eremiobacteraeota bacterium]
MPGRNQDRLIDAGGLALMVAAPLACSPWLADGVVIPKLALFLIGCHLILAGWLWGAACKRWSWLSSDRLVTLTTVLLLWWSLAGTSWSWHWAQRLLLVHLALLLQALAAVLDPPRRQRWTGWLMATGLLVTLYSVLQRLDLDPMGWKHPLDPFMVRDRTISTFGNPNYFAAFTAVLVPLGLARLLTEKQPALAATVAGLAAVTVILSQTRAAWLALAAAAAIMAAHRGLRDLALKQWRPLALTAMASLVLLVGLSLVHPESDQRSEYRQNRQEASITTRLALWTAALCITEDNLWTGTGPDGFSSHYLPYRGLEDISELSFGRIPEHCHHELLTIWFEAGLAGVVLSLALALFVCYRVRIAEDPLAQAAGAALLGLLVNLNFITATLTLRALYLFLLVFLIPPAEPDDATEAPVWPALLAFVWIVLVTGYAGRLVWAERQL